MRDKEKHKIAKHNHYIKNKEAYHQCLLDRRAKNKNYVFEIKLKSKCLECGENNPYCLDFHHLKDKIKSIAELVYDGCSISKIDKEIEKCIILCSNCHIMTSYRGVKVTSMTRQFVLDFKKDKSCILCGESRLACLHFHHRKRNSKLFTLSKAIGTIDLVKTEIEKCDLICSNCHRKLHQGNNLNDMN